MYPDIVNMYIAGAVIPLLLALALCAAGLYVLFGLVRRKRAEMLQTARDEEAIYAEFREMRLTRGRSKALLERHRQERDADISPEQHPHYDQSSASERRFGSASDAHPWRKTEQHSGDPCWQCRRCWQRCCKLKRFQ